MINAYTLGKLYGQTYGARDTDGLRIGYGLRKKMIRTEKENDTNSHTELTIRTEKVNDTNSHAELTIRTEKENETNSQVELKIRTKRENDTNTDAEVKIRTVESSSPGMTVGRGWGSSVVIAD